ncbi:MAG: hypothetical protein FWF80_07465, partial [Defluviitaleaceae bacterium]|nr:hypothetical protein [Defluviitaleaceae bacterium]
AFAAMFLVGCWDKVEIEDRAFVVAVGIDARDGEYVVTLSVPIFSDEEENEDAHIKTAQARTVSEALQELCEKDERQLFFGQTQMVIFANDLMEDPELLRGAVDALNKTLQATQRVHVLRADSATEVLAKTPPEKIIPYYEDSIMSYYDFEKSVRVVSLPAPI